MSSTSLEEVCSDRDTSSDSEEQSFTADEVLDDLGCGLFQLMAYLLSALTFTAYAFVIMSFPLVNVSVTSAFALTSVVYATLPATSFLGNAIGSVIFGYLSDSFGRVWPFATFMLIIGVFVIASAFAPNFLILVILRCLGGVGVGGIQSQVYPTLIEFLPRKNRGQITVLIMINQAIGSAMAVGLAWWLITTYTIDGWRYFIIATAIPSLLAALYRLGFYYESPRFLLSKGRFDTALKIFKSISWMNRKELIVSNPNKLIHTPAEKLEGGFFIQLLKFSQLFKPPYLRYTILLAIIQPGARQAYISSAIYFPLILENLHINSFLVVLFGSLSQIPGFLLMSIITEWPRFGRLNTMRLYMLVAVIFYLLFAFIRNKTASAVFAVFIYFAMNPIISIVYTYVSEIYPTEVRGMASGFLNTIQGIVGIGLPFLSGLMADFSKTLPWLFPVGWAIVYCVLLVVSFGLRKETQGKDLPDVIKDNTLDSVVKETEN